MLVTIHFHKSIQKYTGVKKHTLNVTSYLDLLQSCDNLFPKLHNMFCSIIQRKYVEELTVIVDGRILTNDELYFRPHYKDKIVLCPLLFGGGGDSSVLIIVLIIILVVVAVFTGGASLAAVPALAAPAGVGAVSAGLAAAATAATFASIAAIAATIALSLIVQLLTPVPKPLSTKSPDKASRTQNELFEGLQNTIGQGTPVALTYGLTRISGQFISGFIDTVEHGKDDTINVQETYFN